MKKIVLACFWVNETNCGDKLYVETCRKLLESHADDVEVVICDFYGREPISDKQNNDAGKYVPDESTKRKMINIIKKCIPSKLVLAIKTVKQKKQKDYKHIYHYYEKCLENADALLIPGGGLVEYAAWRDYYYLLEMLEEICEKKGIDLYINSIGFVASNAPKKWMVRWQNVLNHSNVKHFTCRDNLEVFKQLCADAKQVPCLASISASVLGVEKTDNSNIVGIGMMRPDAYSDYGNKVTKEYLLDYYKKLIDEICKRGHKVALFSVGVVRDHWFGEELLRYMGRDDVELYERPKDVETFLKQVSSFKGIITVRTHSAYAAYSLNVPAVMIYFGKNGWAGKSSEFMKMMGNPNNAICCDNIMPIELADKFEVALNQGWNQEAYIETTKMCYNNFNEILNKIGVLK